MKNNNRANWRSTTIGDVVEIRRGASPRPIHDFIRSSGMPWVKIADVSSEKTRYVVKTKEFIKIEGIPNSVEVNPGDLILSNSATPGIPKFLKIKACIHDGWLLLKPKQSLIDKRFLYYLLINEQSALVQVASGTVFKNLKTDIVKEHRICLPPLDEQTLIADVISSVDDKVEFLYNQNKTLESIAQAIFKHWFIDFEFPNEKGKPYKSSDGKMIESELGKIPKDWRVGKMENVLAVLESGKRPKGGVGFLREGVPSIGAENILGLGNYDYSKEKFISEDFFRSMKSGVVRNGDVLLYKDGAEIGRKSFFDYNFPHKKCAINEHVFILRVNDTLPSSIFLYLWLDLPTTTNDIRNLNSNSAQPGINQEQVNSLKIIIPSLTVTKEFELSVRPVMEKLLKNCHVINCLLRMRDLLLPKLIKGELVVKGD